MTALLLRAKCFGKLSALLSGLLTSGLWDGMLRPLWKLPAQNGTGTHP